MSARTLHAHSHAHAHGTGRVRAHVTNLRLPGEYDRRRGKFPRRTAKVGMQFNDCVRLADPAPSIQTVTRIMHFYRPARGCRSAWIYFSCSVSLTGSKFETFEIMSPSCPCRYNRDFGPAIWSIRVFIREAMGKLQGFIMIYPRITEPI